MMTMQSASVLVVEDEQDLADLIRFNLEREGYTARHVASGGAALDEVRQSPPDLILLDRMLPEMSGDEVATQIRRDASISSLPILMLTAKAEEADELVGFALGADDYVTKPFSMNLLMARIGAMLRRDRTSQVEGSVLREGPFTLDQARHELRVHDQRVDLTATEFRLLASLMSVSGHVKDRSSLIDGAMGRGTVVLDRTIDVHITSLRKKLSAADPDGRAGTWIHTIRGVGYSFRPPLET
jgi:two-component system phosphate regulon response regulator PhoB